MAKINENYGKLPGSYLFAEIARRTNAHADTKPARDIIKLGIGDVTLPLPKCVVGALKEAADEMGTKEGFYGYGPYEGYEFLREAIAENEYKLYGANISADEIFVSDGAKGDCGNIGDIFSEDNIVAVCDPVYPVYIDANAMSGRAGEWDGEKWTKIVYMPCTAENGFMPELPETVPDLIYLCSPNNPTGCVASKAELKRWVDYANENDCVILYDAAYREFINDADLPRSIYEVEGAESCAIEFNSFSKSAGFTGTRCGWTVIPKALMRGGVSVYDLWMRRQSTKYNGTSYVIQKAAAAVYTEAGKAEVAEMVKYYMTNAQVIRKGLTDAGFTVYGGEDSPYIWLRVPEGTTSWDFFDKILKEADVVTTPGAGFGPSGEGYIRMTAFGDAQKTKEAIERIKSMVG